MKLRTKDARKILLETEVYSNYWTLIGLKPEGAPLSIKEAKRRARQLVSKRGNDILYSVVQFESAVLKLLENRVVKKGDLLRLRELDWYIPAYFPRVLEKISDFGFPVKVIGTEPKGAVKVCSSTEVEIKLKLKP
jgi:hypothetical protein